VIRTGRSELYPDISDQLLVDHIKDAEFLRILREAGVSSMMVVPLTAKRRVFGTICFLATKASGRHYDRTDLAFAEEVARRAAIAVENARLYREAQDANRLKDDFLATLSHELRTPLNAVLGWTRLLESGQLDRASSEQALEAIARNARAQTQLINDLLDVSRIATGKVRLECAHLDLIPVIDDAVDAVRVAAAVKRVEIGVAADAGAGFVWGDRDRLLQVLWNLLSNAVKFTPAGGRVLVRLTSRGTSVEVGISDTGIGISPEFLPYVFDRFRQADSSSTRSHGGLGLGLSIARHLVEMHGGTVRAESAGPDRGATFTLTLPRQTVRPTEGRGRAGGSAGGTRGPVRTRRTSGHESARVG